MVDALPLTRAKTISPADRLELIGAVWGALSPAGVPATEAEKIFLDVRLADLKNNPQDRNPWPAVQSSWAGSTPCAPLRLHQRGAWPALRQRQGGRSASLM